MAACRTLAEVTAAGEAYGASMPPLPDEIAQRVAAILATARVPAREPRAA